jgi:hypothetical protein
MLKVAPWHPLEDPALITAALERWMRFEPAGTVIEGLDGKLVLTPETEHVLTPPLAVMEPLREMAVRVTE